MKENLRSPFIPRRSRRFFQQHLLCIAAPLALLGALSCPLPASAEQLTATTPPAAASPEQVRLSGNGAANLPPEAVELPSLTLPVPSPSAQPIAAPLALPEAPPSEETTFVDTMHGDISKGIIGTAAWFDSFFSDPRYAVEENKTRIVLREDAYLERGGHWALSTHVQIKLVLPWLKNRAHLVLSGDPDEQTATQGVLADTAGIPAIETATKERNTSGAIGYYFKSDDKRNISLRAGIRYRNGKLVFFTRPHYRVLYTLGTWNLRVTQEFPFWSDTRWESQTAIDLERQLTQKYFFRASLYGTWQEHVAGYSYSTVVTLQRTLGPISAFSYEWVNSFVTKPHHILSQVSLDVRYRRQVWRKWMYFEVSPGMRFPHDQAFKFIPTLLFRLEMTFGKT